jgi:hypothetical protein
VSEHHDTPPVGGQIGSISGHAGPFHLSAGFPVIATDDGRLQLRAFGHAAWAGAVVVILALNLVWPLPGDEDSWAWVGGLMAFPVAAAVILSRRPGNGVGRALGVVGVSAALIFVLSWYVLTWPGAPLSRLLEAFESGAAVLQFLGIVALLYVFPTGRAVPGWQRFAFRLFLSLGGGFVVAAMVKPGPLALTGRPNPIGIGPAWLDAIWDHGFAMVPVFALVGVASLVVRWRDAGPVERAQLKWFLAGAVALVTMLIAVSATPEAAQSSLLETLAGALVLLGFWAVPAAVLVAVLRYRLYDIDRLVGRTVTYAVVASILTAVYAGSIVGLQAVLPVGGSDLAVAASTLAAAVLFAPVRRVVRRGLDQRFHRTRYEAEQEVERFSRLLRHEIDLDTLTASLRTTANRTMRPVWSGIWLLEAPAAAAPPNRRVRSERDG